MTRLKQGIVSRDKFVPKKILIYRVGNLGDMVCTIPTMVAIRERFPDAWIGLLTNKETAGNPDPEEVLKGIDFIDEIITYDPGRLKDLAYLLNFFRRLNSLKIETLVYLSVSCFSRMRLIRDWLFFKTIGTKKILGFKKPRAIQVDLKQGVGIPIFEQEVDRLMALAAPLGIDRAKVVFRLPITDKEKKNIAAIWESCGLIGKSPVIAVCVGAKFPVKRWPVENFIKVILTLQEEYHAKVVLIGGAGDRELGAKVIKTVLGPMVNLIGKTTYMESAAAIARCQFLLANDCGPVHLAAAVGIPVVGIYSSRDYYGAWHPWGNNHTILRNDLFSCRFCFRIKCAAMSCIKSISVSQVVAACREYLKKSDG